MAKFGFPDSHSDIYTPNGMDFATIGAATLCFMSEEDYAKKWVGKNWCVDAYCDLSKIPISIKKIRVATPNALLTDSYHNGRLTIYLGDKGEVVDILHEVIKGFVFYCRRLGEVGNA